MDSPCQLHDGIDRNAAPRHTSHPARQHRRRPGDEAIFCRAGNSKNEAAAAARSAQAPAVSAAVGRSRGVGVGLEGGSTVA